MSNPVAEQDGNYSMMKELWTVKWVGGDRVPTMDDPLGANPILLVFSETEARNLADDQTAKWGDGENTTEPEFLGYLMTTTGATNDIDEMACEVNDDDEKEGAN